MRPIPAAEMEARMQFVVVTLNVKACRIVCVDGPFTIALSAQEYADAANKGFEERNTLQYKASVQVITKP